MGPRLTAIPKPCEKGWVTQGSDTGLGVQAAGGADPTDAPPGCQARAPAAAASPCPAAAPCQQTGSRHPDVVTGKSCQGLLAGVSFSPVRLDIFSV